MALVKPFHPTLFLFPWLASSLSPEPLVPLSRLSPCTRILAGFTQKERPIKGAVVKLLCYTGVWNCCFDWLDFKLPFKSGRPNHVSREPLVSRAQAKKDKRFWGSEWAWISLWTGCLVKNVFIPSFNSFNERSQNAIHLLTTNCVFT